MLLTLITGLIYTGCQSEYQDPYAGSDWPSYLGSKGSSQYSTLDQIHTGNVDQLTVAWEFRSGDADASNRSQIQCNPLIIDGILYGSTPKMIFFALNAADGSLLWTFNPYEGKEVSSLGVNRGLVYWESGSEQRLLCATGATLYAIDPSNGQLIPSFGEEGMVDLYKGLGRDVEGLDILANTPGVVYDNLLIMGTRLSETNPAAPGHIRAYHIITGEMEWIFHTIPHPGEFGHDTWPKGSWERAGGANAWAGMSVDEERGIVFIPTGSATSDFYGGDRKGENLFANCLIALNAKTGKRIWHFQTVHHDIWDRDLPAPPNLVTVTHDGQKIDAVAQITKSGFVFLFDRENGSPLFPIKEIPVPNSNLRGEETWPTQPVPTAPPPFARQYFTAEDASDISPEVNQEIKEKLAQVRTGKRFIPPSLEGTVIFPGFDGGGEWGGAAFDPTSGWLYVNANEMPWILTMFEIYPDDGNKTISLGRNSYAQFCSSCHGIDRKGGSYMGEIPSLVEIELRKSKKGIMEMIQYGKGVMPGFPWLDENRIEAIADFLIETEPEDNLVMQVAREETAGRIPKFAHTGYNRFKDENGYPAVKPPWGTLNAIDLNKGEIVWKVPLGAFEELTEKGIPPTGTENYGGPIVTAGGLIFIAASQDEKFRAFDKKTGKILWETDLPVGGYATPSTYAVDGRQYVVIACGGGKMGTKSGDTYIAFSLPE